jgi:hypothetical protein
MSTTARSVKKGLKMSTADQGSPHITQAAAVLGRVVQAVLVPGGIPWHAAPETPGPLAFTKFLNPGPPPVYPCVPVTAKCQDCAGQKVVLLAMTYGEVSTMVPLQAFHAPLLTAP